MRKYHHPRAPRWLPPVVMLSSGLNTLAAVIAAVLLAAMTALIILEICLRFFGHSTYMADPLASYGVAAVTFLAAPWALEQGAMIRVRILIDRIRGPFRILAEAFTILSTGWILQFLLRHEWHTVMKLWHRGSVSQTYVPIPLWIPEAFFATGLALLLLQVFVRALKLVTLGETDDRAISL